ncbi:hypothetical protein L0Y34_02355 [Candidatus Parcubacteria bacterium]|nr:hypothetical protein [Candidatus Parcubacteria bacterium]
MPKTLTDIIPPSRRRAMDAMAGGVTPPSSQGGSPGGGGRKFPWGMTLVAILVVSGSIGVLFAFGGAKVEATPVVKAVSISSILVATPSAGDLPYEVVTIEKTASKEVQAEGTETVDIPAQGVVTIYNGQTKAQDLIKNTRFETPEGLIFRIRESVRVPAGTADAPGELSATVYADVGGTAHNIGPSSFTLPGLAGSAAYELVYARSKEPMVGGFTGERPAVPEATRALEFESMKAPLEGDLRAEIDKNIRDGYVLVPGAVFFSYTPQPDGAAGIDTVALRLEGTAHAFIFPTEALARAIAFNTLGVYGGQPVTLMSIEGLSLLPEAGETPTPGQESFSFTLSGDTNIVWIVNVDEIRGAIAGKSRDAAKTILRGFAELEEVRLVLKPFWEGTLPADPTHIQVEVNIPKVSKS